MITKLLCKLGFHQKSFFVRGALLQKFGATYLVSGRYCLDCGIKVGDSQ